MPLALHGAPPIRSDFPEPRPRLSSEEAAEVAAVLRDPEWSRVADDAPLAALDRLEAEWAAAHQVPYAIAVSSGTAALTVALQALRLPIGDEVLVPAYGCPAVDIAVLAAGLTPIHVEIDPATGAISPMAAAGAITPRTGVMVAVHFAGQPARIGALARVAERAGIDLIEDACLAPSAEYRGLPVGAWGKAAIFSLGVGKPISAGEGGLVVTRDEALAAAVRRGRSLGVHPQSGDIFTPTGNFRLSALAAAVTLPQLARRESDRQRREKMAVALTATVAPYPWLQPLQQDPEVSQHAWAQYWLRYDETALGVSRAWLAAAICAEGIPLLTGWPQPNYCLGMYTPERAAVWLRARSSGRDPNHYAAVHCPQAEAWAFGEALLLDLAVMNSEAEIAGQFGEALARVSDYRTNQNVHSQQVVVSNSKSLKQTK